MTQEKIDLSGLTLLPPIDDGALSGMYGAEGLARLFIESWVPPMECQECGRNDYCKFTKPHRYPAPRSVGRLAEIRCGVAAAMITNYVEGVFPLLQDFSREELQRFLDGSYHLVKFVYDAEQRIGSMINKDFVDWYGNADYKAFFFGMTAQLRRHLDRFAAQLQEIEAFRTRTTVILTEGQSEKVFLERLSGSSMAGFQGLDIQSYSGSGNRKPRQLEALARRLLGQGYQLFVQADADGRSRDLLQALVRTGLVQRENTFVFDVDFESAFPTYWLFAALGDLQALPGVSYAEFVQKVSARDEKTSVLAVLKTEYGYTVPKIELAETLASSFNRNYFFLNNDDLLWSSEIGQFLDKIRTLP